MRDICVDNFLMMCNPDHVERHSDSSDFENPEKIPAIAPKSGNHRLLNSKYCNSKQEKQFCNEFTMFHNTLSNNERKTRSQSHRQCSNSFNHVTNYGINYKVEHSKKIYSYNNKDDKYCNMEKVNARSLVRDKVVPCLSTIFRRSNNNIKHVANIEGDKTDIINKCNRTYCLNCKRRYMNKLNGQQRGYSVQPVYALEENVQTSPFQLSNDHEFNHKANHYSDVSYDVSLSSEAEAESIKNYKYRKFLKSVKDKLEKEIRKECAECNTVNNQQQQYPSKLQIKLPYQVYASTSCLANCPSTKTEGVTKVASISSAFWDFFAQKMKSKIQNQEACECTKPSQPCSPTTCENLSPAENPNKYNYYDQINTNSCCQQTETSITDSNTSTKKKNKENKDPKTICKCYPKSKQKSKSKTSPSVAQDDKSKPCQESHDDITRAISEKYNGEILCIHNPPCILINGCLNLPPPKSNVQGNLWPVTQSKKSSFVQMCRKIKRSKQKTFNNASQYHPPYAELQQCLPEFRSEKIIQSICNHDPPCEIVHSCYRAKYDSKLHNSCVHVPMCRKLPECLLVEKNSEHTLCRHNPKCAELPLCSRKYIVLTAKEEVGTQVRQKVKMVCRHEPHCFMIPKCLAQAISGDYIPYGAIPGCIHNPQCENVPACCRKSFKQMVSVPSQYPNACRIV
ncbi:unnamed protein product, partial [Brenthis ino]